MEIAPIFIQHDDPLLACVVIVATGCLLWLGLHGVALLVRRMPRFRVSLPGALSLAVVPSVLAPIAQPSRPRPAMSTSNSQDTSALYERVPPPRSLVGAEDPPPPKTHPAVHSADQVGAHLRLFPRAGVDNLEPMSPWERGVLDLRRTERHREAHRPPDDPRPITHHVVAAGETLWEIAAKVLRTNDPRAIARYWPRLHKENADVIGRNPDLIRPGQVLSLPPKDET